MSGSAVLVLSGMLKRNHKAGGSTLLTLIPSEAEAFAKGLSSHNELNFWPSQDFLFTLSLFAVPSNRLVLDLQYFFYYLINPITELLEIFALSDMKTSSF